MHPLSAFEVLAVTPAGRPDPSIAIAASRAGALGVLDLEYARDLGEARAACERMCRHSPSPCAVKIDAGDDAVTTGVLTALPERVGTVILTGGTAQSLERHVAALHARGIRVLLETLSLETARMGQRLGVDGLIAKGLEAGGRVAEETTFILLQRLRTAVTCPVIAHGGIGLHTAAACYAGGAAGVVMDAQLLFARESPLSEPAREIIARLDGSETAMVGVEAGETHRVYSRPSLSVLADLRALGQRLAGDATGWREALAARVGWEDPERQAWLLGQDAAFAARLADRFRTVGGIVQGIRDAIAEHVHAAKRLRPLDEGSPLAQSHGTRYPIVQGPMTRVSDVPGFASRVAEEGGLPLLALALLRGPEVRELLAETQRLVGSRPWGVGILGFVPQELREEQLEVVRDYRPPFALIAGGRPDQARELDEEGISTYLHVPSPGLLGQFLEGGARRFVFEGRECGGHVGPRSSFILWNTMVDVLLDSLPAGESATCHVLFAGGVHDALSAAMVATLASPLVERGVRVGVVLGTAYLFTDEAVATGAILTGFQQEALRAQRTVLLETGPGHATRCLDTPFAEAFARERKRLIGEGKSPEEIRDILEDLNLGRLRIAAKGIARHPRHGQAPDVPKFVTLSEDEQRTQGMYMIGQLASLRECTLSTATLHRDVAVGGSELLATLPETSPSFAAAPWRARPADVAIVGMACLMPKAGDLRRYWENILNKVDAITEIPEDRWDWRRYYDPDPMAPDKIYSKWGGFLDPIPFDPVRYGMPPAALASIEPLQLLTLEVVQAALDDAGYATRAFARERASVILGLSVTGDLGQHYTVRSGLPMLFDGVEPGVLSRLPEWTEDSFAGVLLNVTAGRVANRFDFGGVNYIVDAACASSLAAVSLGVRELESGTSDLVVVGGADTMQSPFVYLCFSKTRALSPRGRSRTFDADADGIVISEGVAMVVLKRLVDAERDGDRIYAVIKSVAGSSDGRDRSLTAPRPEGQALAMRRAYAAAGFSPATVGLIEAHGTGTVVGDRTEVETLKRVFEEAGVRAWGCAIGSVKSMIGHTKSTAGVAGLVKAALALHHKVLPPTLHVEKPNPGLVDSPFYANTEARPWVHGTPEHPRRAGISAFGFGGTNFHALLEEYTGDFLEARREAPVREWPGEMFLWVGSSAEELRAALRPVDAALQDGVTPPMPDLAWSVWQAARRRLDSAQPTGIRLAIVATSVEDLREKLTKAARALEGDGSRALSDPSGLYLTADSPLCGSKLAFLFPGQGSQYPDMLRDLAIHFPEVRARFELADRVLAGRLPLPLSTVVYPPSRFTPEEERAAQHALTHTQVAQPALAATGMGCAALLQSLGVCPDLAAGHSFGEYTALWAAGVVDDASLLTLAEARGRFIVEAATEDLGTMLAVEAACPEVKPHLDRLAEVWIANLNGPRQTLISGSRSGIEAAGHRLEAAGLRTRSVPVACAFHSPLVAPARDRLASLLEKTPFASPRFPVFSNATAAPYPSDPAGIAALLADHLVRPVDFLGEIEAMYQAGARLFVEVGPKSVLAALTRTILGDRPHLAVALDVPGRNGLVALLHALAQLMVHGAPMQLDPLFRGRSVQSLPLNALVEATGPRPLPRAAWMVDGGHARPAGDAVRGQSSAGGTMKDPTAASSRVSELPAPAQMTGVGHAVPLPPAGARPAVVSTAPPPAGPADEGARVMLEFQRLMHRFLETQQEIMLAYFQSGGDGSGIPLEGMAAPTAFIAPRVPPLATPDDPSGPDVRSERPPFAIQKPVVPADAPAQVPATVAPSRAPEAGAGRPPADVETITRALLQIVSDRTGYPADMLGLDLNMEADLGIDSIKRVEILGVLQRGYFPGGWGKGSGAMEELTRVKTLRGIADWVQVALTTGSGSAPASPAATTPTASDSAESRAGSVPRFVVTTIEAPPEGAA